ncbi:MAG: hypothetical protein QM813_24735 [Verrucomicrobiota bacterium]
MKSKTILSGLSAACGLALTTSLTATANQVTYQVDMSVQIALGNFNPANGDTVRVAGTFTPTDWTTGSVLTPSSGNPNIYEGTFANDVAASGWVNYRFIRDTGGTGTALNWETSAQRFYQVAASDQTQPVVFYNDVSSANNLVITQVTFAVNMGVQATLGNFNPATDSVYVAGDVFNNNWAVGAQTLTNSISDPNVWQGTFNTTNTVGSTVNYKFVMLTTLTGETWENNGVGPNGAQNRQYTYTNVAATLPTVYFNNITSSTSLVGTQVTFKVNLAAEVARGTFDPIAGTVTVAGDVFNNTWSPVAQVLTQTPTNFYVWSGTFTITNTVGSAVNYKFVLENGGNWETNGVGPNLANDRQFIFTNMATVLPDVYHNNQGHLGTVSLTPPSGGQVTANWTAGPLIRLQTNAPVTGVWGDVPNTLGVSTATVNIDGNQKYFRLIGP